MATYDTQRPHFGAFLRAIRRSQGLSAVELAARVTRGGHPLGVSAVTKIEREGGTRAETAQALASALGVSVDELRSGELSRA